MRGRQMNAGQGPLVPGQEQCDKSRLRWQPRRSVRADGQAAGQFSQEVEPFHLFRYLDEQAYRYNQRHGNDQDRFLSVVRGVVGKRLTCNQLRGRTGRGPKRKPRPSG